MHLTVFDFVWWFFSSLSSQIYLHIKHEHTTHKYARLQFVFAAAVLETFPKSPLWLWMSGGSFYVLSITYISDSVWIIFPKMKILWASHIWVCDAIIMSSLRYFIDETSKVCIIFFTLYPSFGSRKPLWLRNPAVCDGKQWTVLHGNYIWVV